MFPCLSANTPRGQGARPRSSGLIVLVLLLFGTGLFGSMEAAAEQPNLRDEEKASQAAMGMIGTTKFRSNYSFQGTRITGSFNANSISFTFTRDDDAGALQASFAKKGRNSDPWTDGQFRGFPSRELQGYVTKQEAYGKATIQLAHGNGGIHVLFPRYLVSVQANKSEVKDLKENYETAVRILECWHDSMIAAGLIPASPGIAQAQTGSLVVTVIGSEDRPVTHLKCRIRKPGGQSAELVTDAFGRAKIAIDLPDSAQGGVVTIEELVLTPDTRYGNQPTHLKLPLALTLGKRLSLDSKNRFVGEFQYRMDLRPLFIKVQWGDASGGPEPPQPTVFLHRGAFKGSPFIALTGDSFDREGRATLLLPTREQTGIEEATILAKAGKLPMYVAHELVTMPGAGDSGKAVILELLPDTIVAQFGKIRPRLEELLSRAGFSAQETRKIVNVTLRESRAEGHRYFPDAQVIEVSQNDNLRGAAVPLFHEISHHLVDVIAHDTPPGVGGAHDVGGPSNPEHAWDEGRAHFLAALITKELDLPSESRPSIDPADHADNPSRQLSVYKALGEYFQESGAFGNAEDAMKGLRENHARAAAELGRPPRTLAEFVSVEERLAAGHPNRQKALAALKGRYNL